MTNQKKLIVLLVLIAFTMSGCFLTSLRVTPNQLKVIEGHAAAIRAQMVKTQVVVTLYKKQGKIPQSIVDDYDKFDVVFVNTYNSFLTTLRYFKQVPENANWVALVDVYSRLAVVFARAIENTKVALASFDISIAPPTIKRSE